MKRTKSLILILLTITTLLLTTACDQERIMQQQIEEAMLNYPEGILVTWYEDNSWGLAFLNARAFFNAFHINMVLAYSSETIQKFLIWPSEFTQAYLDAVNHVLITREHSVDLESLGLSHPITIQDIFDSPETVDGVYSRLLTDSHWRDIMLYFTGQEE